MFIDSKDMVEDNKVFCRRRGKEMLGISQLE